MWVERELRTTVVCGLDWSEERGEWRSRCVCCCKVLVGLWCVCLKMEERFQRRFIHVGVGLEVL